MRSNAKRVLAGALAVSLMLGCTGCGGEKKEPKPAPKVTAKIDKGNANASGKGDGQDDVPLVIGSTKFSNQFNPFLAETSADKAAIGLTQIDLVSNDRAGRLVYKGIDGELREYNDTNYTYYGPSDVIIKYDDKTDTTSYKIKIRDDLLFSDGVNVNIDDVIFSMYVFCDQSYEGNQTLKNMPIKGIANYWANSTQAEKISSKKVAKYIKKMPSKLKTWIKADLIQKELEQDLEECVSFYTQKGYADGVAYFADKYDLSGSGSRMSEDKILAKAVEKYTKAGYKALAQDKYQDKTYFDSRVQTQARVYLATKKGKKVSKISGIERISDYEVAITTNGYHKEMSSALKIPICALHYYGDTTKYDYANFLFGFTRGDISSVLANKTNPVGAGAYRFVKFENNVVYYTSNELYYKGCPHVAFLQLKDMTDTLAETKELIQEKLAQQEAAASASPEATEAAEPEATVNPLAEVTELTGNTVDVISSQYTNEELEWLAQANSNEKVSGSTIQTQMLSDGEYHYIGIHAKNVSVNGAAESDESKYLRRAFATIFSAARGILNEDGAKARIINYPVAAESWLSKSADDDDYETAYGKNLDDNDIYDADDTMEEKMTAASLAALQYFKKAGYKVKKSAVTEAPAGSAMTYTVLVADGENNAMYPVLLSAQTALQKIGITLQLQTISGAEKLNRTLKSGTQQIWVGSRSILDMDMAKRYSSTSLENVFGMADESMDENAGSLNVFMGSSKRRETYQKCFDDVLDWAVEVPVCELREFTLFSSERIDRGTIPDDTTVYYDWMNEIHKVAMK